MEQNNQTTESAKDFAFITHAARDMAEIMQRAFKVRVKGSSDLSWAAGVERKASYLGKWIDVLIDWQYTSETMLVLIPVHDPYELLQFTEKEFHHMTQVGDFPKIVELYKLYQKTFN